MTVVCPVCNYENVSGALICVRCYNLLVKLDTSQPSTTLLRDQDPGALANAGRSAGVFEDMPTRHLEVDQIQEPVRRFTKHVGRLGANMVALYINNIDEPLAIQILQQAILGRYTPHSKSQPRIDLTPYGAYDKGVSRMHAVIRRTENGLLIEDLDSSNGTWLNGTQVEPYIPRQLKSEDRIRLSQLEIVIFFGNGS